jgi:cell division transport system permease protein
MTFLSALAAGAAVLVGQASRDWRADISREATIQVRPLAQRDLDADVRAVLKIAAATPGIAEARALSREESDKLLEPWLGQGVKLDELPVPRMVVLKLASDTRADLQALRGEISKIAPNAYLDDHRLWSSRLAAMANSVVALAVGVLILLIVAMGLAVSFATRGAVAGNREIIEVLHFVGASDSYISSQFQRRFLWLALRGALAGAALAGGAFALLGALSRKMAATPGADQLEAFFGTFSIGWIGFGAIALIAVASAMISGWTSRYVVLQRLRTLL